jgi:molybdopterin converting factor small subunit
MAPMIDVQITFHRTIKSLFGTQLMSITLNRPISIEKFLENICITPNQTENIFEFSGKLRVDIKVLRNGRDIVFLDGKDTKIRNGDKIAIFPNIDKDE